MSLKPELIKEHGFSDAEYKALLDKLGREPNITELGVFSVMWSEHCGYKHSKPLLKTLPTKGPRVLQGPGENAGIIDLGSGLATCFKIESHNHPSAVEPYQGAATGVGGILRDVFTMGARPVANLNALRFGPPDDPAVRRLAQGVVKGIADYGNCVGVPTVAGDVYFEEGYRGNPLVNAMTVGLVEPEQILRARAEGLGLPVVYIGAATGRDGIHGATFASVDLSEETASKRSAVQVADPFLEKLLLEATLELGRAGVVHAIQDMGAAGLTSSSSEMAARGGRGVILELDRVPRREPGMTPYELLLSESQERMLMVLKKGQEDKASKILEKWGLHFAVVGEITDSGRMVVKEKGAVVADLPASSLAEAPTYTLSGGPSVELLKRTRYDYEEDSEPDRNLGASLLGLLGSPNICSRAPVYSQYDHTVRTDTVFLPGADAGVLRMKGRKDHLAVTVDGNGRYGLLDPYVGAALAVCEAGRNLACSGAEALGLTNCLNFGNPEKDEPAWQFREAIRGLSEACAALSLPVVSGNVSFYNEGPDGAIPPTPVVGLVGLIPAGVRPVPSHFHGEGDLVLRAGWDPGHLGGSEYQKLKGKGVRGKAPALNLDHEARLILLLRKAAASGLLRSAHDVSDGGWAVALAECCLSGSAWSQATLGVSVGELSGKRAETALFAEGEARAVLSAEPGKITALKELAKASGVPLVEWGKTGGSDIKLAGWLSLPVKQALGVWRGGLAKVF